MLYAQPNPMGRDFYTEKLIAGWYARAKSVWGVTDNTYNCFGEAQRNPVVSNGRITGYMPQWKAPYSSNAAISEQFLDGAGNATDGGLFYEDSMAAVSFVGFESDETIKGGIASVKAKWFFFLDLKQITPGGLTTQQQSGQRLTEVAMNDVVNYVRANGNTFFVDGNSRNIDKVLEWYSGTQKQAALLENMNKNGQEQCCFCINMHLNYNPLLNTFLPLSTN